MLPCKKLKLRSDVSQTKHNAYSVDKMTSLPPRFYVATWVNYHGDLTTDTKIFMNASSIMEFFLNGFRILSWDESDYNEAAEEISAEMLKYSGGRYKFHYSDMAFHIIETSEEGLLQLVLGKLPAVGHILYNLI